MYICYTNDGRKQLLNLDNVTSIWLRPNAGDGLFVPSVCYTSNDNPCGIITSCNSIADCNEVIDEIYQRISKHAVTHTVESKEIDLFEIVVTNYKGDRFFYRYPRSHPEYMIGHITCDFVDITPHDGYVININNGNTTERLSTFIEDIVIARRLFDDFKNAVRRGESTFNWQLA